MKLHIQTYSHKLSANDRQYKSSMKPSQCEVCKDLLGIPAPADGNCKPFCSVGHVRESRH